MKLKLPGELLQLSRTLQRHGFQCYLVGGAVRDMLLKKTAKDFDVATNALPDQVMKFFRRVIPTGIQHGTVTVLMGPMQFEVTTFRVEGDYSDHRHPDSVTFTRTIDADLERRDFTINAIAYDMEEKRFYDPFRGGEDLKQKVIRAIGDPGARFQEDGLRMLRAARIAAQLSFCVDQQTVAAMAAHAALIDQISAERIRDEFVKTLESPRPSVGLELLRETGLLIRILPELSAGIGVVQPSLHCFDVYTHSLAACDAAPRGNLHVRLAALFHDVGKPVTRGEGPHHEPTFYGHEKEGARLTAEILTRLRFPHRLIQSVTHLVAQHMFNYDQSWTDAAVRRFIRRVGLDALDDLFSLRRADQAGMCGRPVPLPLLTDFRERIKKIVAESQVFSARDLAVDGNDLIRELGIPPGREIGLLLEFLLEGVLDDPEMNSPDRLLEAAKRFLRERLHPAAD
ncbi:MAG TPA: HD domain-containing protein [Spirochaetia bacterium]|nr:HD domain-containing protein [Spirochaetia bacterium]